MIALLQQAITDGGHNGLIRFINKLGQVDSGFEVLIGGALKLKSLPANCL
jgi:hypothetical protein